MSSPSRFKWSVAGPLKNQDSVKFLQGPMTSGVKFGNVKYADGGNSSAHQHRNVDASREAAMTYEKHETIGCGLVPMPKKTFTLKR